VTCGARLPGAAAPSASRAQAGGQPRRPGRPSGAARARPPPPRAAPPTRGPPPGTGKGQRPAVCRGVRCARVESRGAGRSGSAAHSLGKVAPAGHRAPVHAARRASWACFGAPERAVGRSYPHPNPTLDVALGSRPSAHTSGAGAVACLRLRGAWARLGHMRRGGRADAALPARRRRVARLHLGGGVDRQVCACAGHAQTHSVSGEARTRCA